MARSPWPPKVQEWRTALQTLVTPTPAQESSPALETFLLGEGVESVPAIPEDLHADLWMLGTPTYQRRIVFTKSIGSRFGNHAGAARFLLDRWQASPPGFRWTLDPSPPDVVVPTRRAQALLDGTFVRTQVGLCKLAVADHGGDLEAAIIQAIDEYLTRLGLDRFIPDHEEAPHG